MILYLLGIFVIVGGLEITGVTSILGSFLYLLGGNNPLYQILMILWMSAFLSSNIENIPITKVLIPIIAQGELGVIKYYSLAIGANWGDDLTPFGDNIVVMNTAEQNKRPFSFKQFFKLGFTTIIYQLLIASLIFILLNHFMLGVTILSISSFSILVLWLTYIKGPIVISLKVKKVIDGFRKLIIN